MRRKSGDGFQSIQLIKRTAAILEYLDLNTPELTLTEIADRLDMYPSSTYRLLQTLVEVHLLTRSPDTERYRLGPRIVEMAGFVFARTNIVQLARPSLERLARELNDTMCVSVYHDGQVTYLDSVESSSPIKYSVRVGATVPALWVGSGQAMLALMPEEAERLFEGAQKLSRLRDLSADDVRGELTGIRERGYALDPGHYMQNLGSVACAVVNHAARPVGALTLIADRGRFEGAAGGQLGQRVHREALDLSRKMGYVAPQP